MKRFKFKSAVVLFGLLAVGVLGGTTTFAESALDAPAVIQPASANGKKILFDNTHAQTAGAADWVIDGGFSDFANALGNEGYYVTELRKTTPITLSDLEAYDVFVIPEANIPFKQSEQQAIADYVSNGGAVFYIGDHYNADRNKNRIDTTEAFNGYRRGAYSDMTTGMSDAEKNSQAMQDVVSSDWLSNTFGLRFRFNAIDNVDASSVILDDAYGILNNVDEVPVHAGATLAITNPETARGLVYLPSGLTSANKWSNSVDQGVYNGGGKEEGAYVAISKRGQGKAAFVGDSSIVEDASPKYTNEETGKTKKTYDGFKEGDDATLLVQLIDWLGTDESYSTFSESGISLSEKTALYDYETPENTTETQSEPWSTSQAQYKWYDSSTFAAGSYGSSETPAATIQYGFNIDSTAVGKENKVTITLSGLTANSTVEGLDFGLYTPTAQNGFTQGAQVAQTKIGDNAWNETLGYSNRFNVTADANGNAVQDVYFKVSAEGSYNIRLRNNKTNVLTQAIVLKAADETVTPEEPETPTENSSYDVTGNIEFQTSDQTVYPTDPESPNDSVKPVLPDGTVPDYGSKGLLSIDYASSFAFGKQEILGQTKTYGAYAQKYQDSDALSANYIQVSDRRGTNAGWVLNVVQNGQFKTADNEELTGAELTLGNGKINSSQLLDGGLTSEQLPKNYIATTTLQNEQVSGGLELIPGQSSVLMSADRGQGSGVWTLAFGSTQEANIGISDSNKEGQSSVFLTIPGVANPLAKNYQTSLTYRLSMVPAP
ncbi:MAG: WxL domain-containing protein [Streptococcaceae bacterium]|jgi:hypothetical protein|nr:WxL domain-containing protein [Streptococcaceae bacterium]